MPEAIKQLKEKAVREKEAADAKEKDQESDKE